jgi:hypothetical protein
MAWEKEWVKHIRAMDKNGEGPVTKRELSSSPISINKIK